LEFLTCFPTFAIIDEHNVRAFNFTLLLFSLTPILHPELQLTLWLFSTLYDIFIVIYEAALSSAFARTVAPFLEEFVGVQISSDRTTPSCLAFCVLVINSSLSPPLKLFFTLPASAKPIFFVARAIIFPS